MNPIHQSRRPARADQEVIQRRERGVHVPVGRSDQLLCPDAENASVTAKTMKVLFRAAIAAAEALRNVRARRAAGLPGCVEVGDEASLTTATTGLWDPPDHVVTG